MNDKIIGIGVEIETPSQKMFYPGWINHLELGSVNAVPFQVSEHVKVALRCHNLLKTICFFDTDSTSNWSKSIEATLKATKLFTRTGLTRKGMLFQRHCLGYLTFCCNEIKPFVVDEARWLAVRNELFRKIVPTEVQTTLQEQGDIITEWV